MATHNCRTFAKGDGYVLTGGWGTEENADGNHYFRWNDGVSRDLGFAFMPWAEVDKWYCVALTHNGTDWAGAYVNGELKGEKSTTVIPTGASGYSLFFSRATGFEDRYSNCLVAQAMLYDRVLSDKEHRFLASHPLNVLKTGLVFWAQFQEGADSRIFDCSEYASNGSVYGGFEWRRFEVREAIRDVMG